MSEKRVKACEWTQEDWDSDCWQTSCGNAFCLNDGTPSANDFKFCCYCGSPIEEHKWQQESA